ncbi:MAG: PAS domain S-box protein, partial [Pseudanabaena sp. CAN_BIN31]|nr:PAS domain S-box protein [Pseudanabaena sp. CAN_BIN31]
MIPAQEPTNELERVAALYQCKILDTESEQGFDDITQLAAYICQTPIALVSLIDKDRQWFKSKVGLTATETPRKIAFCTHAILQDGIFIVNDTLEDERFADNPVVTHAPKIRFYAGVPIKTVEGYPLGTLCVLDYKQRELDKAQINFLKSLGNQVSYLIETRRNLAEISRLTLPTKANPSKKKFLKRIAFGAVLLASIVIVMGVISVTFEQINLMQWLQKRQTSISDAVDISLITLLSTLVVLAIFFYFIVREVNMRRQLTHSLEQERDFTVAVLDTVAAMVIVLDPEGRIIRFNSECERVTGYHYEEVRNQIFWKIFLRSEDVQLVNKTFANSSSQNLPNSYENYWIAKNGQHQLISWSTTALLDDSNQV